MKILNSVKRKYLNGSFSENRYIFSPLLSVYKTTI